MVTRLLVLIALILAQGPPLAVAAEPPTTPAAARIDPYTPRPRLLVLSDIANEPDDQMSLVRLLLYSNQIEIEGLVATTSTWMKKGPRPDVMGQVIDAYDQVQPNLLRHQAGFPAASALRALVTTGQPTYGMDAVGPGKSSAGSQALVRAVDRQDPRPLWIAIWGGANTLAQALVDVRASRSAADLDAFVARLRVYSISDQDDAGPWIRREFPALHYIAMPSPPDGQQYSYATWTGISGDRFYRNGAGADFTTFTDEWVNAHIRSKGPLGARYPHPCCIHEGDTPSFLALIDNGLASMMSPAFGGWGGRYVWRQPYGETRPFWSQGGDSYPGNDNSQDTVVGRDEATYTSDQATIWRWRTAYQHDFAARMDWSVRGVLETNHGPDVVVNGVAGRAPIAIEARVGTPIVLDAAGTRDPDGNALAYRWFYYPEAGTGIPGQPVFVGPRWIQAPRQAGAPPGPPVGLPTVAARVTVEDGDTAKAAIVPRVAGIAHVILAVEDDGSPSLTSYRRVILTIRAQ